MQGTKKQWPFVLMVVFLFSQASLFWLWKETLGVGANCEQEDESLTGPLRALESPPLINRNESVKGSTVATRKTTAREKAFDLEGVEPRAFEPWPSDVPLPCIRPEDKWWHVDVLRSPARTGFLFVKEMKCGSSTLAGIAIRIARSIARKRQKEGTWYKGTRPLCKLRFDHTDARKLDYGRREKGKSFLWTVIREPAKRITSQFYHFEVSRAKVEPNDANFKRFIKRHPFLSNYYLKDLMLEREQGTTTQGIPDLPQGRSEVEIANQIIHGYDFIGITERMHESLVALQMILGLEINDILYLKAKGSGNWDDGAANEGTCHFIFPSYISPGMKEYFDSDKWKKSMSGDYRLYHAANKSLDLTIDRLGRKKFGEHLAKFEKAMALAAERCLDKAIWPCSPGGERTYETDCLWNDSGCGASCLDEVADV